MNHILREALVVAAALLASVSCTRASAPPCPPPFTALPNGTCIAAPAEVSPTTPVLVFLHGMAANPQVAIGNAEPLAAAATRAGIVVLAPLGRQGPCNWSPEFATWHCWPTRPDDPAAIDELAARLRDDLRETHRRHLGLAPRHPTILSGFSNGGFAAAGLVGHGALDADALAVFHAGSPFPMPREQAVPTLLRTATGDEWHHSTMVTLRDRLVGDVWPVEWQEREGGHALTESDVSALVDFVKAIGDLPE